MENSQIVLQIEKNLKKWISNLREIENLASDLDEQATELENESSSKKSLMQILKDDFNYDRNDLRTFTSIQRDYAAEAYVKQLENTLEVIMNKYRKLAQSQLATLLHDVKDQINEEFDSCCNCRALLDQRSIMINALIKMMDEFLVDGHEATNVLLEENMYLKAENMTLRQIVAAAEKFGLKEDSNNNNIDA